MAHGQFPNLNAQEADFVVQQINERLDPELVKMVTALGLNAGHMIRFLYIASLCRNCREECGLSLKEASQQAKIPQYRLKAIEGGAIRQILPESLDAYIQFLGLTDQFARWRCSNEDVYAEIGSDSR